MKLKRYLMPAAFAITALIGLNGIEARAGSVTQSAMVGQTAAPFDATFSFNAYNGLAGTLTSVELTVEETINGQILIRNYTVDSIVASASITGTVNVTSPAGSMGATATASVAGVTVSGGNPGTFTSDTLVATGSNTSTYTGSDVNGFYGATTLPISIHVPSGSVMGNPIGLNYSYSGAISSAVKVTLVYNTTNAVGLGLDPAAIPEPTSSAMFGIGIVLAVGLGWGRKRRELKKQLAA